MISRENYEIWIIDYLDGKLNPDEVNAVLSFLEANPDLYEEFEGLKDATLPSDSSVTFERGSLLKDELPTSEDELDLLLAKRMEGDLTAEESAQLDSWLKIYPKAYDADLLMRRTKLQSSENVNIDKTSLLIPSEVDYTDRTNLIIGAAEGDLNAKQEAVLLRDSATAAEVKAFEKIKLAADESVVYPSKNELLKSKVVPLWIRYASAVAAACLLLVIGFSLFNTSPQIASTVKEVKPVINDRNIVESESESMTLDNNESELKQDVLVPLQSNSPQVQYVAQSVQQFDERETAPAVLKTVDSSPILVAFEEPIILGEKRDLIVLPQESVADNQPAPPVNTARSVVKDIIKSGLWGSSDYPEDNYVLALAEKGVQNLSENRDADVALSVTDREESGIHLKLGRFEYSSTRGRKGK